MKIKIKIYIMKKLLLLILISPLCSCSKSGFILGEEVNVLGSLASVIYVASEEPEALNDNIRLFDYNEPPKDEYFID